MELKIHSRFTYRKSNSTSITQTPKHYKSNQISKTFGSNHIAIAKSKFHHRPNNKSHQIHKQPIKIEAKILCFFWVRISQFNLNIFVEMRI